MPTALVQGVPRRGTLLFSLRRLMVASSRPYRSTAVAGGWGAQGLRALPTTACRITGAGVGDRRCLAARGKGKTASAVAKEEGGKGDKGGGSQKHLGLSIALKKVEMSHGSGSIMKLGSKHVTKVDTIPTGSISLDHALGVGGLPKGRVIEMYGPESSGKTTVALHVVAECQKMGGTAVFIDAEHALDSSYANAIGVDIDGLYISQPDNGEQGLDIVDTLVKSDAVDVVVVDSVAALVPKAELDGEMGDHHIALQARLMSQALRKLTATLSRTSCTIIFINQIRQKVGVVFGSPDVTTGGMALRFYSSVRLDIRKGHPIKLNGEDTGMKVKIKVAKNKLAPPFQKAEVDLVFGKGFDRQGELIDLGERVGLINKSGSWFGFAKAFDLKGTELEGNSGPTLLGQGREKSKAFLASHPVLASTLEKLISERLASDDKTLEEEGDARSGTIPADPVSLVGEAEQEASPGVGKAGGEEVVGEGMPSEVLDEMISGSGVVDGDSVDGQYFPELIKLEESSGDEAALARGGGGGAEVEESRVTVRARIGRGKNGK